MNIEPENAIRATLVVMRDSVSDVASFNCGDDGEDEDDEEIEQD
jgi:hypothetical protein